MFFKKAYAHSSQRFRVQVFPGLTQAAFVCSPLLRPSEVERLQLKEILLLCRNDCVLYPDVCFPQQSSIHLLAVLMVLLWFIWSLKTWSTTIFHRQPVESCRAWAREAGETGETDHSDSFGRGDTAEHELLAAFIH